MQQVTIPVVKQLEELVRNIPGWTPIDQLYTLFSLAYFSKGTEGDFLELGSWCGRSAVALGLAARHLGNTRVFCFDLFPEQKDWFENPDGTFSFEVTIREKTFRAPRTHTIWKSAFERDIAPVYDRNNSILRVFRHTIQTAGLSDLIIAHRGDSSLLSELLPKDFKCRLAFIDADHSYDAVRDDIKHVDRYLVSGGWLCFDDAFSEYEGVSRAIEDEIMGNPRYELSQQMTRKLFVARRR